MHDQLTLKGTSPLGHSMHIITLLKGLPMYASNVDCDHRVSELDCNTILVHKPIYCKTSVATITPRPQKIAQLAFLDKIP